jgi:hypothetical protein
MKEFNKKLVAITFVTIFTLGLAGVIIDSPVAHAVQPKVDLKTATPFVVLAGTPNITDAGGVSTITGDVGLSPATGAGIGLLSSQVTGTIYATDNAGPAGSINNPGLLTTAKNDLTAAYVDTAGRTPVTALAGADNQLGGQTLTAGVYTFGHATTANLTAASPLTLDAQNDPSAVFIFQASSDLITASSSVVRLVNGAQACNVFWQVTSSATLGTSSTFVGTIMALTSIGLNTSVTMNGRALARNGAVTLSHNTIAISACTDTSTSTTDTTVTPKLPNPGSGPMGSNNVLWIVGASVVAIVATLSSLFIIRKKRVV